MVEKGSEPRSKEADPQAVARWIVYKKMLARDRYARKLEMIARLRG